MDWVANTGSAGARGHERDGVGWVREMLVRTWG